MKIIFVLILPLFLIGCATNYGEKSTEEVAQAVKMKDSEFDKVRTYIEPPIISNTQRGLFTDNETVRLFISKDKKNG